MIYLISVCSFVTPREEQHTESIILSFSRYSFSVRIRSVNGLFVAVFCNVIEDADGCDVVNRCEEPRLVADNIKRMKERRS